MRRSRISFLVAVLICAIAVSGQQAAFRCWRVAAMAIAMATVSF